MDKVEATCSCGATLKIQTDFSLDLIVKAMFLWQKLHQDCRLTNRVLPVDRVLDEPDAIYQKLDSQVS